ncbi:MAG: hypothetical protein GEU97_16640 [Actinophytocola sp.]|nr:hypothetical protein [Actinophytocola sp.]
MVHATMATRLSRLTSSWPGMAVCLLVAVSGCTTITHAAIDQRQESEDAPSDKQVSQPNALKPDVLVINDRTLTEKTRNQIRRISGVEAAAGLSVGLFALGDRAISVGAVEGTTFRRFVSAHKTTWDAVGGGDAIVSSRTGLDAGTTLEFANSDVYLHVADVEDTVRPLDALVSVRRGAQVGIDGSNAVLVSIGKGALDEVITSISHVVPSGTRIDRLAGSEVVMGLRTATAPQAAFGGSELGSFSYEYFPDGSVRPDPDWVATYIRTEAVPILGNVTCHRVMLPRLRGALTEVVRHGLAGSINPDDYGGCYVPRFIDRDPRRGLSLHTWGIALDLNVAGNHRGTRGEIDRRVVDVFKRWGFAWGGDWTYTDPMHFELVTR